MIEADPIDFERLRGLIQEAQSRDPGSLNGNLSYVIKNRMEQMMQQFAAHPEEVDRMRALERLAELVMPLPLGLNLWKVQNTYWEMLQTVAPRYRQRAVARDEPAQIWLKHFLSLGQRLQFATTTLVAPPVSLPVAA